MTSGFLCSLQCGGCCSSCVYDFQLLRSQNRVENKCGCAQAYFPDGSGHIQDVVGVVGSNCHGEGHSDLEQHVRCSADDPAGTSRHERSAERWTYHFCYGQRDLTMKAGKFRVTMTKMKGALLTISRCVRSQ